jgi:acetolactate synthase-1/2/3 large subunit
MQMTGARIVIESLINEGVDTVFGYPGGAIMNVYDEIYKQNKITHILNRHEQACVISANGYARVSGKVGVAIVTSGPGFTNAITGIADAYMDSIPIVIVSGQVPLPLVGTDGFQEIDAVGISRPCTKHNFLVKDVRDLARIFKEAFYIARSGRPGPVLVDIPKDITSHHTKFSYPDSVNLPTYKPTIKGNINQVKKLSKAIMEAKKPLFYIGGGAVRSSSTDLVRELVELTHIPCVETLMARGILGYDNPFYLGMVGMHGSYSANMAMSEADLIVSIGARFDDRVTGNLHTFGKNAKIAHIDIDPASIAKIVEVDYPIVGDVKVVLKDLINVLEKDFHKGKFFAWNEELQNYKSEHPLEYEDSDDVIKPQWVIEQLGKNWGDEIILSTDVGQHQMWAAQFYPFRHPDDWLSSSGLGTMGFGLPAAIGAKVAKIDKISVNVSGDGSILMNIHEIMTASQYGIPVINVILNNSYLGMVRQWQSFFYDDRFSETNLEYQADFIKIAEGFGGIGYKVKTKQEFLDAIKDAISKNKTAIIDVDIHRHEDVLPMVPAAASLNEMILFKDTKTPKEQ